MDQAVYRGGRRQPCSDLSDELAAVRKAGHGWIWIGLKDPTDAEFDLVKDELQLHPLAVEQLHPLAVEDAVTGHQRPKLEVYDASLFVVVKPLRYIEATSDIETGEVMVFLGDRFVVTVRRGEAGPLAAVRRLIESDPVRLDLGPVAVLHGVMDAVVDNYDVIDAEIQEDMEGLEAGVFAHERSSDAQEIYALKREVLEFRRAALPLIEPARRLAEDPVPHVPDIARPFFRDVGDHLLRSVDHIESYDRLLSDILSAHLAQVSVRQNDDMRKISAWVAIAAVPTMIAGIYGMNFQHMPELGLEWGYPGALLLMLVVCTGLFRAFKRSGWL
jgi:magnesium transporter